MTDDAAAEIERLHERIVDLEQEVVGTDREVERLKQLVRDLDTQVERMGVILNEHVPDWMTR